MASEFEESTNSVRLELNRLKEAGLLESEAKGNLVMYNAKTTHPLFPEIKSIVSKITGIDSIIESVIQRLGSVEHAYLIGDYAKGKDSGIIDVVVTGNIDKKILQELIEKAEDLISRKIRAVSMTSDEFDSIQKNKKNHSSYFGVRNSLLNIYPSGYSIPKINMGLRMAKPYYDFRFSFI